MKEKKSDGPIKESLSFLLSMNARDSYHQTVKKEVLVGFKAISKALSSCMESVYIRKLGRVVEG